MGKVINNTIGRIRKSVGQNNFYVRAGVQVVRLKPSFSPDRKFTQLQISQQGRMKIVRKFIEMYDLKYWANSINTANNRRYNASSRYNRLLGFLLKNISERTVNVSFTEDDIPDWIEDNIDYITAKFAVGNIPNPIIGAKVTTGDGGPLINFTLSKQAVQRCLAIANRRRIQTNWYSVNHLWAIGWITSSTFVSGTPFMCDYLTITDNQDGTYKGTINPTGNQPGSSASGKISVAVFLHSDDIDSEESAAFSSNNIVIDWSRS